MGTINGFGKESLMSTGIDQKVIVAATATAPVNAGTPTQVANPKRASWRTYVQSVVGFLVGANIVLPIAQQFLVDNVEHAQAVLGPVYGWLVLVVNGSILVLGLLTKAVALFMANPKVNAWIVAHMSWLAPIKPTL